MKTKTLQLVLTLFQVMLLACSSAQESNICFPDKGIKTAITSATISSSPDSDKKTGTQEIHFNLDGQPTLIKNSTSGGSVNKWEYQNGNLAYIITTRKLLPDFYQTENLDSLLENADIETDTTVILKNHIDGRPIEYYDAVGQRWIYSYSGCDQVTSTTLNNEGDTLNQVVNMFEGGVLITSTWIPYYPTKGNRITEYFGHKLNKHGDWIRRKYRRPQGIVVEKRKLIYY